MRVATTPAVSLMRELRDEVRRDHPRGRVLVAVDGVGGAGKTTFADAWADVFAEDGVAVFRASLDDFFRPRAERYARGRDSAEGFYRDAFDYSTFRRVLVDPFRTGEGLGFELAAFDARRDAPRQPHWVSGPRDAVLLVDGVFALRPELRALWHFSVLLDVPVETALARMTGVDGVLTPGSPLHGRYGGAWDLYRREARPARAASAIVDNADPGHPVRTFLDYC